MFFLPSSSRVTARTCVSRVSPPSHVCAKSGIRWPVKICGGCRAFIRRLLAISRTGADESRAQTLFRYVPQENKVFRTSGCDRGDAATRVMQLCPRRELLSFRHCRRSCGPAKCQLIFIGYIVWRTTAYRFAELRGCSKCQCGYVRTLSTCHVRLKCYVNAM